MVSRLWGQGKGIMRKYTVDYKTEVKSLRRSIQKAGFKRKMEWFLDEYGCSRGEYKRELRKLGIKPTIRNMIKMMPGPATSDIDPELDAPDRRIITP